MQDDTPRHRTAEQDQLSTDDTTDLLADRELIVVSNRQPYTHTYDGEEVTCQGTTGGLASGLNPLLRQSGGTWIAWGDGDADGAVVDENDRVRVPPDDPEYSLRRVWLSEANVRGYYEGFSNRVLWPICHTTLGNVHNEATYWQQYRTVNERFAEVVTQEMASADDPLVWFQDYHLALAPRLVRRAAPWGVDLMHFWHVPWPSWDVFRACPHGRELLRGLLGNDVVGFHVPRYRRNFLNCVDRALGEATVDLDDGTVRYRGDVTSVEARPLGVDADRIRTVAAAGERAGTWSSFAAANGIRDDGTIAVGVERLDYTKGIPERLRALERVWETSPEWRGELTYVQNASESRSGIPEYAAVQESVESEIERINDRFGTDEWTPVVYTTDRLDQETLYGLYRRADLAIVSPIRDGLNLVALEYVAAQGPDPGALVLADQAGAHDRLGEYAFSVSPQSIAAFADTIRTALNAPVEQRRRRMRSLQDRVAADSLSQWVRSFVESVSTDPEPPRIGHEGD